MTYLRVVLSAILAASAVQCNDFVTQDVAACRKTGWNGDVPLQALAHKLVGGPGLRARGQALLSDLEEVEIASLSGGAAAGAFGKSIDDGSAWRRRKLANDRGRGWSIVGKLHSPLVAITWPSVPRHSNL